MRVAFRNADYQDAETIVPMLRYRDRVNLLRVGDPCVIIREALDCSISNYVGEVNGEVAVMWGLRSAQLLDNSAYVWMLGTTLIDQYPMTFLRFSAAAVKIMRKRYRLLYGEIETDFKVSERWLTWLGATVQPTEQHLMFSIGGQSALEELQR